jgi:hypothetical protein
LAVRNSPVRDPRCDPKAPFPDTLSNFPGGPGCASAPADEKIPAYTFSYEPRSNATGKIADFRLTAVPKTRGLQSRNPLMTDQRGIVFVDYPWEVNSVPKIIVIPSDRFYSQVDHVKSNIEAYMWKNGLTAAPASLTEEMILPHRRHWKMAAHASARCGTTCAIYRGNVHGTGEPREATAKDPLSPKCEEVQTMECTDIFWMP